VLGEPLGAVETDSTGRAVNQSRTHSARLPAWSTVKPLRQQFVHSWGLVHSGLRDAMR
jgi:hypothetical protein